MKKQNLYFFAMVSLSLYSSDQQSDFMRKYHKSTQIFRDYYFLLSPEQQTVLHSMNNITRAVDESNMSHETVGLDITVVKNYLRNRAEEREKKKSEKDKAEKTFGSGLTGLKGAFAKKK